MAIYLGNGHSLVTAMLGKTTKAVRVYFLIDLPPRQYEEFLWSFMIRFRSCNSDSIWYPLDEWRSCATYTKQWVDQWRTWNICDNSIAQYLCCRCTFHQFVLVNFYILVLSSIQLRPGSTSVCYLQIVHTWFSFLPFKSPLANPLKYSDTTTGSQWFDGFRPSNEYKFIWTFVPYV